MEARTQGEPQPSSHRGLITRSLMSNRSADRKKAIAKIWLRLARYGSVKLCRLPARVCDAADLRRIEALAQEMAPVVERDPTSAAKYADYDHWVPFNVARIGALGLHASKPRRILDIGCGPGYFMASALACGHDCYGIDAPDTILTKVESRVYSEMLGALAIEKRVSPLLIERHKPMALPPRDLDLVTAYWICFNRHRQPDEWGVAEWRFWVDDALTYLRPAGVLHLELNENPERYGSLIWYDKETLDYFRSAGTVQGGIVRIIKG
jgi:SAM-dependent methyltransferase